MLTFNYPPKFLMHLLPPSNKNYLLKSQFEFPLSFIAGLSKKLFDPKLTHVVFHSEKAFLRISMSRMLTQAQAFPKV